jgi:hypothetical protein
MVEGANGKPFIFDKLQLVFEEDGHFWVASLVQQGSQEAPVRLGSIAGQTVRDNVVLHAAFIDLMKGAAAHVVSRIAPKVSFQFGEPVERWPEKGQGSP